MDPIVYIALGILAVMLVSRPLQSSVPWMLCLAAPLAYGYIHPAVNTAFWVGLWLVFAGLDGVYGLVIGRSHDAPNFPPPPGPTPWPIIGNLLDLPPKGVAEYQHWLAKHKDRYGGISSVSVLGAMLVIVHDRQVAQDLLEKSDMKKVTAGRAYMPFAAECCGYGSNIIFMPFSDKFKRYRRLLGGELGTGAASRKYEPAQEEYMLRQLVRIYDEPERLLDHYKTGTAATIMKSTYGYNSEAPKKGTGAPQDRLVMLGQQWLEEFSAASVPMKWMVDIVPALKYVPAWVPGAGFQTTAQAWRKTVMTAAYVSYRYVQKTMAQGTHGESYMSRLLTQLTRPDGTIAPQDEDAIIWTSMALFGAGSDTTTTSLLAFTLAMVRSPGVQEKARAEMDRVVGRHRIPTTKDKQDLPYIGAIVAEVLRWWPIAPLGFPHKADANIDYVYDGTSLTIPKGALILPSVWHFMHDPAVYAEPDAFDPDRFLAPRSEPEPTDAFGYGRRVCPGRFFAKSYLYTTIAQLLSLFTIGHAVDADGNRIGVDHVTPQPGIIGFPPEFAFSIKPRDEQAEALLEKIRQELPEEQDDLRELDEFWESPSLFEQGKGV